MFEKLFLLVKNNAGTAVVNNPLIAEKHHNAVMIEASSSIIEVLKGQMENGKLTDLVKYFQSSGIYNNSLVSSIEKRFANRLNTFYGVPPKQAIETAKSFIPHVMKELVKESKSEQIKEFGLSNMLTKLNGNRADLSLLVNNLMVA
jgi:polyribonucleotide nucleotidyltransferase